MGKGTDAERKLFKKLWSNGFAVMRSPSSGGGRKHPQPDLLASNTKKIYGIESKRTGQDTIYLSKNEVAQLKVFCRRFGFGCEPLIAVRFNYTGWVLMDPDDLVLTKKSCKVDKELAGEKGTKIDDL